jgi:hypothetical protein
MSDVYDRAKELYKSLYKQEEYSEDIEHDLKEGLQLLLDITAMDIRLSFKLGNILSDRINLWGTQLQRHKQTGTLNGSGITSLETLCNISSDVEKIMYKLYSSNGGKEIEQGRELIQNNITEQGLPLNDNEIEIVNGINLMVLGSDKFSEVDLYKAQINVQALRFFIEETIFNHASNMIQTVWLGHIPKLNNLVTQSIINFYPDLTSN